MIESSMFEFEASPDFAGEMDTADPLKGSRENFFIPKDENGSEVIYFTGNSLGLQPKSVRRYIEQELKDWETLAVEGHLERPTSVASLSRISDRSNGPRHRCQIDRDRRDEFANGQSPFDDGLVL